MFVFAALRERRLDNLGGAVIGVCEEVAIDVQRHCRAAVTQPTAYRQNVHAARNER